MFSKVLVANRGEIACRVIHTCRRLGVATVAVYSEADRDALHVRLADQAVLLGPAAAAASYLNIERVVQACLDSGADAVHPGYGFLSENAAFATALADAGITFVGPPPAAIEAMGDKIRSKKIAERAGVNVIPGLAEALADADQAVAAARDIGYPVMLKASAGGGGKGMRVAYDDEQCRDGFARASSEAQSSFGDPRVFIEKFIERPRHIEIQLIADRHGTILTLGERECSLQRRHQKVIEEAPSPLLDEATREAMAEQARRLAAAVDYRSAGTVEFVADAERNFYFLEMNTRLQVEHPVTEKIFGLDLVELMLREAAGSALPTRDTLTRSGWAVEARIYAEDPARNFLPAVGRLIRYRPPPENETVRLDSGVYEGAEVSLYYDPMIAKLVCWGINRDHAISALRGALDRFYLRGVTHNMAFLTALLRQPEFVSGDFDTGFIGQRFPDGFRPAPPDPQRNPIERRLLIAVAAVAHYRRVERAGRISGQLGAPRPPRAEWVVLFDDGTVSEVKVAAADGGGERVWIGADPEPLELHHDWRIGQPLFCAEGEGQALCVQINPTGTGYCLTHHGWQVEARVFSPRAAELAALMPDKPPTDTSKLLLSPMPGLLTQVLVETGQEVETGQALCVVEAMKMENVLRAAQTATVAAVLVEPGASLAVDQPIIEFG